ncbi:conjugal transfer protein [Clostridioides difficile]|nr:conjugal transfer protein [Clostridioides difficile]
MEDLKRAILFVFYPVFRILCSYLGWNYFEQRMVIFKIWYQVSSVIWVILAVTIIVLFIKLLKLTKLRNRFKH